MICYDTTSLSDYLEKLAAREPVPGGGSAAALSGAMGAALVQMVAKYSLGKGKPKVVEARLAKIDREVGEMRGQLLALVSSDAQAYLQIVAARKQDKSAQKTAAKNGREIPRKIKKLAARTLSVLPYLRKEGNIYLLSDVDAAEYFLAAAVNTSDVMIKANA